jgi:mRNA-degrading endonuclease YafQ of YafQ-DinJ toxin-antitoxin module
VPIADDPAFTAAISYDEGVIYISEGFLVNKAYFYQLNVLMRHELAHNLLMHQIRMMYKLSPAVWKDLGESPSLHEVLNVIMDDEISHKKYTDEDKEIVRKMFLNGRTIGGLITEDHRPKWLDMPLEKMYDEVLKEIEDIHRRLRAGLKVTVPVNKDGSVDPVTYNILGMMGYTDTEQESMIKGDLATFLKNKCRVKTPKGYVTWQERYRKIAEGIAKGLFDQPISDSQVEDMIRKIADARPLEPLNVIHPLSGEVLAIAVTPEDKEIASSVIKKFRSEYSDWYKKVLKTLTKNSADLDMTLLDDILKRMEADPT